MKLRQSFSKRILLRVTASTLFATSLFGAPYEAHAVACAPTTVDYAGDGTVGDLNISYRAYSFLNTGTCDWTVPSNVLSVSVLVVGGGGGGGSWVAGGGGGGGVVESLTVPSTPGSTISIVVGTGGNKSTTTDAAVNIATAGNQSSFGSIIAYGGGRGGTWTSAQPSSAATGGGGSNTSGAIALATISPAQGFSGGSGNTLSTYGYPSGGGGGAGGAGQDGTTSKAGDGGVGRQSNLSGINRYYGGGGGGGVHGNGTYLPEIGIGGLGGGGNGDRWISVTNTSPAGQSGSANTGGGGGGAGGPHTGYNSSGGNGGSGIVIVRTITAATISQSLGTGSLSANSASYRTPTQVQVASPLEGSISFYQSGKIIPGCRKLAVTPGGSASCIWKPSQHGFIKVSSTLTLKGSSGVFSQTSASYFVPKRTGNR